MRNQRENLKKEEGKELSPTFVLKKKKTKSYIINDTSMLPANKLRIDTIVNHNQGTHTLPFLLKYM